MDREVAPQFAEIWVRPLYEPSFRETAVQNLYALHDAGAIPSHDLWEGLMVLHETDRAIDLAFESFDESTKTVRVLLQGACSGCPSSTVTLKNGIETMLREMLQGKVEFVEAING